ncbi:CBS domain-containing protein [Limimaricola cinnabarinus]|jgi:CBS domain-containing protein|uniref:Histidine kinase n=1 Tax=Limimaricola cinnabarinus TaxID=1125964 RepID=A0A2G1MF38_9RHOB|nr:CBS domain-containing protein [Limimaricola cinnabarinus]PHP27336.1 histidine kinase [Limimaricola cinnabarinus]
MLVQQILKSKANDTVATVAPDTTVTEAVRLLSDKRIGALVVSQDGKRAQGIISERDIVREIGQRGPACLDEKVSALMTADPVTCHRDEAADLVLGRMTEGRFRHIPVVEGEEMIGLISIGDVVKARLAELSMEKDALEGMIMGH